MKAANDDAEPVRLVRILGDVSADAFERLEVPELVRVEVKWLGGKNAADSKKAPTVSGAS